MRPLFDTCQIMDKHLNSIIDNNLITVYHIDLIICIFLFIEQTFLSLCNGSKKDDIILNIYAHFSDLLFFLTNHCNASHINFMLQLNEHSKNFKSLKHE